MSELKKQKTIDHSDCQSNDITMFPVPTDVVLKLIEMCSSSGTICNNCNEHICATVQCFKCKKQLSIHNDRNHDCFKYRQCRDCCKIFCKDCMKYTKCNKPTIGRYRPYKQGKCYGIMRRCPECLKKHVCERCKMNISRCWYCETDPDGLSGAYLTDHVCDDAKCGWYSGRYGFVGWDQIENLEYVD